MKVLIVTEYFYPQSFGGTELYVYNLAKALEKQQLVVTILSVSNSKQSETFDGLNIDYIPFNQNFHTSVINGSQVSDNLYYFIDYIKTLKPDVIHFHTLTTSISAHHVEAAKEAGFKTLFTSHIASHTCIRGTLMQLGKYVCDGKVEETKCLNCYLQNQGVPQPFNYLASLFIRTTKLPKNTAQVVQHKKNELQKLNAALNSLVVVSEWQRGNFIKNGFDPKKINLCRQAIATEIRTNEKTKVTDKLVIGFIGRITAIKGLPVLLESLKYVPAGKFELRIAAINSGTNQKYFDRQKTQVKSFPNSVWIENLPNNKIANFMQQIDLLCVPSQIPETGPFVVYEALAQGIPVLGSNLGGIAELVTEGKNGWLFPFNDEKYLGLQIASFIEQKLACKLLTGIEPIVRPVEKLAEEMLELYQAL